MRRMILISCTALCVLGAQADAANRFPPAPGSRVRVTAPRYILDREPGLVTETGPEGLVVKLERTGEPVRLASFDILWLEVSRGRKRATMVGAAGGALAGGLLAALSASMPSSRDGVDPVDSQAWSEPPSDSGGSMFLVGALLGGVVGALVGSAVTFEDWEPVFTALPFYCSSGAEGGDAGGLGARILLRASF